MKVVPVRSSIHQILLNTDTKTVAKDIIQSLMLRSEDITDRGSGM